MRPRFFAVVCWCLIASGLNGCALFRGEPAPPPLTQSQQRLYDLSVWTLEGRIGAKMGREGWSANLVWEHEGAQDRLRVFGPFNQGTVSVVVQGDLIYVDEGAGSPVLSHDPDGWLRRRLGFSVPLRSLRYWVLGLPNPAVAYQALGDAPGGPAGFEQQNWVLAFERFEAVGDLTLPQKMSIQ